MKNKSPIRELKYLSTPTDNYIDNKHNSIKNQYAYYKKKIINHIPPTPETPTTEHMKHLTFNIGQALLKQLGFPQNLRTLYEKTAKECVRLRTSEHNYRKTINKLSQDKRASLYRDLDTLIQHKTIHINETQKQHIIDNVANRLDLSKDGIYNTHQKIMDIRTESTDNSLHIHLHKIQDPIEYLEYGNFENFLIHNTNHFLEKIYFSIENIELSGTDNRLIMKFLQQRYTDLIKQNKGLHRPLRAQRLNTLLHIETNKTILQERARHINTLVHQKIPQDNERNTIILN